MGCPAGAGNAAKSEEAAETDRHGRGTDDRLRERFWIGTSEDNLIGSFSADFVPDWRRRDEANSSLFIWNGPPCRRIVHVLWQATQPGILAKVTGAYQTHCLRSGLAPRLWVLLDAGIRISIEIGRRHTRKAQC
jgi:hypothetical protein